MKPGQISATKAYAVSESLMNKSNKNKKIADYAVKEAKGRVDRNASVVGLGPSFLGTRDFSNFQKESKVFKEKLSESLVAKKRIDNEAKKDSLLSVGLKSRADAAMAKANAAVGRDTPLPSSEGIMSKITSTLSDLFK